jgi:hypothetical protein
MMGFVRFVWLEIAARKGYVSWFYTLYKKNKFGEKYGLLADIMHAKVKLVEGKTAESVSEFNAAYDRLTKFRYFNVDTKIYIANYIYYHQAIAAGITRFRINPRERPLNINNVSRYMIFAFYHYESYDA